MKTLSILIGCGFMQHSPFNLKLLAQIFIAFFKIGPATFGGGYAMIPLIEKEVVDKRKWVESKDIADIFALSQSIPGAIAINSATFIGYRLAGVFGAIVAMAGVVLPPFGIVALLSLFFLQVQDYPKVEAAFVSIRATIVALITYAAIRIGRTAAIDKTTIVLIIITVAVMGFVPIHPMALIIGGAVIGIVIVSIKKKLSMQIRFDKEAQTSLKHKDYYFGEGI